MKPQRAARGLTPRLRARTQAQRKKFAAWATKLRAAHADCVLGDVRWEKAVQLVRGGGGGGVVIEPSNDNDRRVGWGKRESGGGVCVVGASSVPCKIENTEREIDTFNDKQSQTAERKTGDGRGPGDHSSEAG